MQKLEQFSIPNDIYAKFFCNGMLLVGIDSFDFAIFSKQRPSLFKPECFSGFLTLSSNIQHPIIITQASISAGFATNRYMFYSMQIV